MVSTLLKKDPLYQTKTLSLATKIVTYELFAEHAGLGTWIETHHVELTDLSLSLQDQQCSEINPLLLALKLIQN